LWWSELAAVYFQRRIIRMIIDKECENHVLKTVIVVAVFFWTRYIKNALDIVIPRFWWIGELAIAKL
jgi:hypothetical protein